MSQAPPTRRRRFQFGIGTMLLIVTVFAWLSWELKFVWDRHDAKAKAIYAMPADGYEHVREKVLPEVTEQPRIPIWRRWLGDEPFLLLILHPEAPDEDLHRMRRLFPEATVHRQTWGKLTS